MKRHKSTWNSSTLSPVLPQSTTQTDRKTAMVAQDAGAVTVELWRGSVWSLFGRAFVQRISQASRHGHF